MNIFDCEFEYKRVMSLHEWEAILNKENNDKLFIIDSLGDLNSSVTSWELNDFVKYEYKERAFRSQRNGSTRGSFRYGFQHNPNKQILLKEL